MHFLAVLALLARLAGRIGVPGLADWRAAMRWSMALTLGFFGTDHMVNPERYLPIMPEVVLFPLEVVLFTGLCEIAGGLGLLVPRLRRLAGIMLAIYFVCVFPANIRNALGGLSVEGLPAAAWYYWLRLPFQPVAIWWALYAAGVIDWPRRRAAAAAAA